MSDKEKKPPRYQGPTEDSEKTQSKLADMAIKCSRQKEQPRLHKHQHHGRNSRDETSRSMMTVNQIGNTKYATALLYRAWRGARGSKCQRLIQRTMR